MSSGAVLAGGKSERFGSDKRFFKIGNKTLLEIACEKVKSNFEVKYLVVDSQFKFNISDFIIIKDKIDGKGPLIGIYSALCEVKDKGCVFVPVDMPFLPDELLRYISSLQSYDAVYINFSGKIYPIPGYYSKDVLPLIKNLIECGNFSIKKLLDKVKNKFEIREDIIKKFGDPSLLLLNINKPSDFRSGFNF